MDFRATGDPDAVRKAAASMGGADQEEEPEVNEHDAQEEQNARILELLSNAKNQAVVSRILPAKHARRLHTYQLPLDIDTIIGDVFNRFGGKTFRISIHPVGPTGMAKTLEAFVVENPDCDYALEVEQDEDEGEEMEIPSHRNRVLRRGHAVPPGGDPYAVPSSPLASMRKSVQEKTELLSEKLRLQQAQQELEEMKMELESKRGGASDHERQRLEQENRDLQRQIRETDKKITELQMAMAAGPKQDTTLPLLMKMMESNQQQFTAMMGQMQQANQQTMQMMLQMNKPQEKKEDALEVILEKAAKFKTIFGASDSRVNRLEELAYESLLSKIDGGGGSAEEETDTVQYAIKQLTPVLKTYVDKKLDQQGGPPVSDDERKRLYKEAAMDAAKKIAQKMEKDGVLVRAQKKGQQPPPPGLPAPKPGAQGAAPPASPQAPPAPQGSEGQEREEEVPVEPMDLTGTPPAGGPAQQPQEGPDMTDVPTPPGEEGYDRGAAVNFVLDIAIGDIVNGCPDDSFLIGDILDRLDEEMLDEFLKISTADDLEGLFAPHADPLKIQRIKELGADERVKSWLTRVIVTAQDERRKILKDKTTEEPKEAGKQ